MGKVMYEFIKHADPDNPCSNTKIEFAISQSDLTWTELREIFDDFLRACGYRVPEEETYGG